MLERASPGASCPDFWQIFGEFAFGEHLIKRGKCESPHEYWDLWWAWVDLNHRPRPYQYCGPLSRSVILRDTGCDPARQSKADALARVAATRGRGASKAQQALVCLGTQAERPRFQDGILEGMLGHSRNPSPTSSTRDLPCSNARRAPNRWHPKVSRRRCVFCWKILVDFELQALISSGKSTVPSRVNSAAYANAASISGSVSAA